MSLTRIFEMFSHNKNEPEAGSNTVRTAASTPQYVITCPDFFHSLIEGWASDTAPCLWVEMGTTRYMTYDSADGIWGDGRIAAKYPKVCMKYGTWAPLIHQALHDGKVIESIIIKRITSVTTTKTILQETTYSTCEITIYEQRGDKIVFGFSYINIMDVGTLILPSGETKGNVGFQFDYGTLKSEEKSGS